MLISRVTGAEQWRGSFGEWAKDNEECLTPLEILNALDAVCAGKGYVINMGAGGVFELRRESTSSELLARLLRDAVAIVDKSDDADEHAEWLSAARAAIGLTETNVDSAIGILAKRGITATWEHPGYIRVFLFDRRTYLAIGDVNGPWNIDVVRDDGATIDESGALELPRDASPEQLADNIEKTVREWNAKLDEAR